jgi:predicted nucleic acid-binding protein
VSGFVIDSSGWLDYFMDGKHSATYLKYLQSDKPIWLPSLVIYEVYKKVCRERSEADALLAVTQMEGQSEAVIPLDDQLAMSAADVSLRHNLAMADAIIYTTAQQEEAILVTGDKHFKGLPNVVLVE